MVLPVTALAIGLGLSVLAPYPHAYNYLWPITEEWLTLRVALEQSTGIDARWAPVPLLAVLSLVAGYVGRG